MTTTQHTGATISLADAEDMLAEVRKIMADKALNYGPAVDEYIRRRDREHSTTRLARLAGHD